MAFSREYAHRPPIPTAEEIMEDFTAMKNKDFNDPVLTCISDNLLDIHEQGRLYIYNCIGYHMLRELFSSIP